MLHILIFPTPNIYYNTYLVLVVSAQKPNHPNTLIPYTYYLGNWVVSAPKRIILLPNT